MIEENRIKFQKPKHLKDAIALLIALLTSAEAALYFEAVSKNPIRRNADQGGLVAGYTLSNWASGKISDRELRIMVPHNFTNDQLQSWALSFVAVSTYFFNNNVNDPIKFLLSRQLIKKRPHSFGYEPDPDKVREFFQM